MNISGKLVSDKSPVFFIADIAANHDGDINRAKDLIYLAAESGADAAKFQHFQANTIVSDFGFKSLGKQISHQSKWKKSVYEIYKDASVDLSWTEELKETCIKAKIPFFTTPYSLEVIDFIDKYVPAYKIGSGDITWLEIIKKIAMKNKPYILATGASDFTDVIRAVKCALEINSELCLMQCNTNYTASLDNFRFIHLNVLKTYKEMFPELILGLSDHTPGCSTVLGAVALGAKMIEKHFTDDNNREGPDHLFSMNPKSWKNMVDRTRELELALGTGIKKVEDNEKETVVLQRRSWRASRDFEENHLILDKDFEPLRPCPKDALMVFHSIKGKVLNRKIRKGDYLKIGDLNE
tara:strand:+ start:288 stop:1343 length:1056 start_codon:yes stop_codon:yes gene_type:complete